MKHGKEFRSKALSLDPTFAYLPDEDRYITHIAKPQYKLNIIGTGINGQEHIRVTALEGRATVHGIYDPNPRSVQAAIANNRAVNPSHELVIYESLEAACNDPEVDGLVISTPNYTHLDVVKVAAQSGKHILLEKPIATTLADAMQITDIANNYSGVFQIGLQYRYKSMIAEAIHEVIDRQAIGTIHTISMQEHRIPFLDKVNQWNKFSRFSGNTLVEKCCHYFDMLNYFAQSRPTTVYASGGMNVNFVDFEYNGEKSDVLDNALVIINYENGVRANFNLCMFAPIFYEELIVCGDEGRLKAWEQHDYISKSQLETHLEIMRGEAYPSKKIQPGYPVWIEQSGHNGATYYEHMNFIDNIEGSKTITATADEGLWSVIVALAAQESIATGQVIHVEEFISQQQAKV